MSLVNSTTTVINLDQHKTSQLTLVKCALILSCFCIILSIFFWYLWIRSIKNLALQALQQQALTGRCSAHIQNTNDQASGNETNIRFVVFSDPITGRMRNMPCTSANLYLTVCTERVLDQLASYSIQIEDPNAFNDLWPSLPTGLLHPVTTAALGVGVDPARAILNLLAAIINTRHIVLGTNQLLLDEIENLTES